MSRNPYNLPALLIFLFFLMVAAAQAHGQEYSYINYDTKDGLAGSTVYDCVQDNDGFMWFATENGVSRFDGQKFTNFTMTEGLPDNEIIKIFVDSKNRVWIMPFKAEVCYWYKGKLHTRKNDSVLNKLHLRANIFGMHEDKNGNILISEHSIFHILHNDNRVETINNFNEFTIVGQVHGLDKNGEIRSFIYGSDSSRTIKFFYYPISKRTEPANIEIYANNRLTFLNKDMFAYQSDVNRIVIDRSNGKRDEFLIPDNTIELTYHRNDTISINTNTGSSLFDLVTKKSVRPLPVNTPVISSFQDKEDNYWYATRGKGVYMIPSLEFKSIILKPSSPTIWTLANSNNSIYAGGEDRKTIWKAELPGLNFEPISIPYESYTTSDTKVTTLTPYKNSIIVGTSMGRPRNDALNIKAEGGSMKYATLKNDGVLYSSHVSLFKYNLITGKKDIVWHNRVTAGLEGDSGYYIGTLNGLFFKSFTNDTVFFGEKHPFLGNRIAIIAPHPDGTILVGTKGGGLAGLKNGQLTFHLTERDGLSNNFPTSIHISNGTIWLGTEKGLNRIEKKNSKFTITRFSVSNGLPSDLITAIESAGDTLFIGSPKGLTYFVPGKISMQSSCNLQFTGIYISDKYWAYDSSGFALPHSNNNVRFEFSGISFKSAGEIVYQYRLTGLHNDWRTTTNNTLNFPALPSGEYKLQLKAINKYGVATPVKEISFVIEKLLWERTGFRLLMLAALGLLIWFYIRYRLYKIKNQEKEKNQLNNRIMELEQAALRSQMNPHFIFNSLNSIQQYVVERDLSGANKFITDFSHLIRMTLDYSSKSYIKLSDELQYIETYLRLEKTRLENKFDYTISIENGIDPDEYTIPSLLLQPFVENSIRHGIKYREDMEGLIRVYTHSIEKGLLITIEDNGVGRQVASMYKTEHHVQYQSKGMLLSSGRIDLLNNEGDEKIDLRIIDLYNGEGSACGTKIELLLFSIKKR